MYFHKDPEIIELIYSILHFKNYNEPSFITMINSIDNFLKIKDDIEKGVLHVKENMDVAKDFLRKSLESLHSFVYNIPVVKLYDDIYPSKHLLEMQERIKEIQEYFMTEIERIKPSN